MTECLMLLGTVVKGGGMCPESSLVKDQDQVSSRGSVIDPTFLTQTQCSFHDTTQFSLLNCAVQLSVLGIQQLEFLVPLCSSLNPKEMQVKVLSRHVNNGQGEHENRPSSD